MACAMDLKPLVSMMSTLAPASVALTIQSGTPASACDLPAANTCHTPDGPAAWIAASLLPRSTCFMLPSSA
ncbi:hypothetical protein D3C86_1883700 [compost metagenome]